MTSIGVDTPQFLRETLADNTASSPLDSQLPIRNRFERILTLVEVLADGFTVAVAVVGGFAAYHALHLGRKIEYPFKMICLIALALAVLYVILLDREGAYELGNSLLRIKETERSLRVSAQTFLLALPVTFFSSYLVSRWVFLFAFLCVPVLQVMEKQLFFVAVRILRSRGFGIQRVLIYGAGFSGRRVFSALIRSPKLGLEPVIITDDNPDLAGQEVFEYAYRRDHSIRVVSEPITKEVLDAYRCRFVIIAIPNLDGEKFDRVVAVARAANARLAFVPGRAVDAEYWTEHADVDGILLNLVGRPNKGWYYETAKRPFDVFATLAFFVLLGPLLLLISVLVRLDSPGPVFFRQQRVGRDGRLFDLFKFRTMRFDAPQYAFSPTDVDDPRITGLGRFLRRTSLDELPQLINVLKGDMSLVGPRPEMPFIVKQYNSVHRQRLQVTPGITGLWQLSADRRYLIHENVQYDLYYIRNRSFFMDLAILLHTLVFAMRGV